MQKLIVFLYTSNEHVYFKIRNTLPIILAPPQKNEICIKKKKKSVCVQSCPTL